METHNVNVGFSIDGYKELHDKNRCGSYDKAIQNVEEYKRVTGHYPTFNATVGTESLKNADKVIAFFKTYGTRITFSRMIGKYGISLQEYRDFLTLAEKEIPIRRGGLDCTMYGGQCGAGTNNYFFSNGKVYFCGNLLKSEHRIRKNVEIGDGTKKTEIDALIVTEKAAFIIEVKNPKRDIFIDEAGNYYKTGEFLKLDCDLGNKLEMREEFVRKAAEKSGIKNLKVVKIVVFTDNRISIQNKFKSIKTCFLSNLTSIVDTYVGEKVITLNEMDSLMESVDEMTTDSKYAPAIDINKFKADFAEIVTAMETKKTWITTWRELVSSISHRKIAA